MVKYLLALLLLLIPSVGYATTYTVCGSGCTGTGIQAVLDSTDLNAGDILEVRADTEGGSKTYSETVTIGSADSGDADNHVIIRARAGDTITIDGGDVRRLGISITGNNITVDGFRVDNIHPTTAAAYPISATTNSQSNITIKNCTVNISLAGGTTSRVRCGIAVGGSSWAGRTYNMVVQGNTMTTDTGSVDDQTDMFHGTNIDGLILDGNYAVNNNATTSNNHNDVYQMWNVKNGIYRNNYGNSPQNRGYQQTFYLELYNQGTNETPTNYGNQLIYNNVFVGYGGAYVFYVFGRAGTGNTIAPTLTAEIYNNVFHAFANTTSSPFLVVDCKTTTIKNNIIIDDRTTAPRYAIAVTDSTITQDAIVSDYNIFYTAGGASSTMSYMDETTYTFANHKIAGYDTHGYFVDPSLDANYKSNAEGDPAVGTGVDLSATIGTTDKDGNTRSAWDIGAYEYGGAADETAPTISSATINTDGDTLTLVFDEVVTVNTSTGFTLGMSGGAAGLTYSSGSGTNTLAYNITGRNIDDDETGTLDYATVANGIEDAAGNDLASTGESDIAVTNNSTYSPSATTYNVTPSTGSGCAISPMSITPVVSGETASFTCLGDNNHSCVAWTGTCGGTGTTSFTSSAIRDDCTVIQPCLKIAPEITIGSGAAVTLGTGAVGTLY